MLKIYNSLTQQKEIFKPIQAGKIKIYVCGVTVYDYCHLGHARTYTAFDTIIRYLRWRDWDVTHVRNITDIDDKIIKRANENHEECEHLTARFTKAMEDDFAALHILSADHLPSATHYIPRMIELINQLIVKEYAYIATNGDVYYNIRKFKNYGRLAHRDIDKLESGARVEINDVKRDPLDFVLWKLAKPNEPFWESPWGAGRPGWHTECSAMSLSLLGEQFDIHGGGKDLIFPHHENEIAQSEAITQKQFVTTWMHAGFLQIDKEKMSKSLGNFLTIRDLLEQHLPEVVRYFLISSHYRSPISYSEEALLQAKNALARFYTALRGLPVVDAMVNSEFEKKFIEAMDDDFNTPIALSVLFDLAHEIQRLREKESVLAAEYGALLKKLGGVLGILQSDPVLFFHSRSEKIDSAKIETLIKARQEARAKKDFAAADRIRAELSTMSVELEDSSAGTTWRIIN